MNNVHFLNYICNAINKLAKIKTQSSFKIALGNKESVLLFFCL